ncbi:sugar ABC transporter ATP-binding protein [Frankia gtarii]|uniref:sugar ABC transporter ATP-binding protein n=1 Tax=Frankia gtarii TaxID=2950102 RepID=UPI0021C06C05|nr:sugar ABC transporter ATP-binding protein [Frankia gtarii]
MTAGLPRPPAGDAEATTHRLEVRGLTKTFVATPALQAFDLTIAPGEVHALLGENGSGKSTFIKILSGYHTPDPGGEVFVGGSPLPFGAPDSSYDLGCRFVHQDLGLVESLSVADNLSLTTGFPTRWGTVRGRELRRRVAAALEIVGLDIDPHQPVSALSPAMKTGVAVARALREDDGRAAGLLVLDEPTATLPVEEVRHLLEIVRTISARGIGVVYVTHHLDEVFELADRVSVLRDGQKVVTTSVRDIDHTTLVHHLIGRGLDEAHAASTALPVGEDVVLAVADLAAGPLRDIDLRVRAGEVVGIAGLTGSGRDTLLPAIFGAVARSRGTVRVGAGARPVAGPRDSIAAGLVYLPADRKLHGGVMSLTARENLTLPRLGDFWRAPLLRRRAESSQARDWFARLDVRPADAAERPLFSLSGGNQQKVLVAKWLRCSPTALLLDEPTQGVDIGAKAEIHRQLLAAVAAGAGAVVSSADIDEVVALSHRVLVLRAGRVVAELVGDEISVATITRESLGSGAATQARAA